MTSADPLLPASSHTPDWETLKEDLKCPLCDYNLRGLTEPRCPECGFQFTWQELFDAERDRHQYLFEDHPKRNIWSFWKTFWNDCRPRRFWRELSPAHAVRIKRLLIYWLLANGILLLSAVNPFIQSGREIIRQNTSMSRFFMPVPGSSNYQYASGMAPGGAFIYTQISASQYRLNVRTRPWDFVKAVWAAARQDFSIIQSMIVILVWPWATLLSLLIFQASMRRAKIKTSHVLRCAIYGCDFCLLLTALLTLLSFWWRWDVKSVAYMVLLPCSILATYRLTFAYKRYLRFSHPFLTVLASQIVVFLVIFDVMVNWMGWW
jgi:hypothetical protein